MSKKKHNISDVQKRYGKRYAQASEKLNAGLEYEVEKALEALATGPQPKFDATINVAFNLGVDPRQADQGVRGVVALPHGTGKKIIVAVIANEAKCQEAKAAGADVVGGEDLIEKIKGGFVAFDRCIATPDMMGKIGVIARVLGPKGLMPNPKLGTVTPDVAQAVNAAKSGTIEYRADKGGVVHAGVGKVSFGTSKLFDNVKTLVQTIIKAKPQSSKGTYMKSVYMSATMGPSVKLHTASLNQLNS